MGVVTSIGWTESSWNAVSGCTEVSPGCEFCYARDIAERFRPKPGTDPSKSPYPNGFDLTLKPGKLLEPLRWKTGRRIFVNSMSDLFHRNVPRDYVDKMFAIMAVAEQHAYQILTKRPERMKSYCNAEQAGSIANGDESDGGWERRLRYLQDDLQEEPAMRPYWDRVTDLAEMDEGVPWPLPNVWLGVSVEDQRRAARIETLRQITAAVRFVSFEPLLGPVETDLSGINWIILGAESGANARPMELAWVRSLIAQARAVGCAVFVKQLGTVWAKSQHSSPTKLDKHGKTVWDSKGENQDFWPEDLRIQEYPTET